MTVFEIRPGHTVTGHVFEQVRAFLAAEYPDVLPGLTWEAFTAPAAGAFLIPDPSGLVSKLEMILTDTPALTVKVNRWYHPDLRAGARPAPHNHRWAVMRSRILSGAYREHTYRSEAHGVADEARTHEAGADNVLPHHDFHEVEHVEPDTWTCFVGTRSQPGDWGYLDIETGHYTHNAAISPDPGFTAAFRALNP